MNEETAQSGAAIADELRNVVNQAEALLGALDDGGDAALESLRQRVSSSIDTARARLSELEEQANRVSYRAEEWVRENPWAAVAVGASLGLLLGLMLTRRRNPGAAAPADSDAQGGAKQQ